MTAPAAPKAPEAVAPTLAKLRDITESIPDRPFGVRLRRVFEEAARTIAGLGNLGLGKYDDMAETGTPDLSMWEELAPVIRDTLLDVNRLLSTIRDLFPSTMPPSDDSARSATGLLELHKHEATQHVQSLGNQLASEVSNLGERMRSPQVVSDRWNLLSDLQEFRGKFRSIVGDLIYLCAAAFESVARKDVIPGYAEELREAIVARRTVTDLARVMGVHASRVQAAQPEQLKAAVAALVKDIDAFGRSPTYAVLRTPDKRRCVEFRSLLHQYPASLPPAAVCAAVAEFAQVAQGLSGINKRAILVDHDREMLAACAVALESVDQLRAGSHSEALLGFAEAVAKANDLYGRHPTLDAWLRKTRKRDLSKLPSTELGPETELLRGLLAAASAM
jgi:hypothetical protein